MDTHTILPAFAAACKAAPRLTIRDFLAGYPIEQHTAIMDAIEDLLVGAAEIAPAAGLATPEILAVVEAARLRVLAELEG